MRIWIISRPISMVQWSGKMTWEIIQKNLRNDWSVSFRPADSCSTFILSNILIVNNEYSRNQWLYKVLRNLTPIACNKILLSRIFWWILNLITNRRVMQHYALNIIDINTVCQSTRSLSQPLKNRERTRWVLVFYIKIRYLKRDQRSSCYLNSLNHPYSIF